MHKSDIIIYVVDAQSGITHLDETVAEMLRKSGVGDRILVVANKVDSRSWEAHGHEAAALGLGEAICISSTSGHGIRYFTDILWGRLEGLTGERADDPDMKLAIIGKRNAGKSSLTNALAGENRVIVSEIAGTTRDSVDVQFEIDGKSFTAIDTAGVRKQKSFADDIEYYAYRRMIQSIRRADVTLLLVDATDRISQVDKKLAMELQRQFKPTVIVVNKWDLVDDSVSPEDYLDLPHPEFEHVVVNISTNSVPRCVRATSLEPQPALIPPACLYSPINLSAPNLTTMVSGASNLSSCSSSVNASRLDGSASSSKTGNGTICIELGLELDIRNQSIFIALFHNKQRKSRCLLVFNVVRKIFSSIIRLTRRWV